MKNSIGWNFPSNNNGQIMGISEAGIETFKGSLISSLTREICQNSLDAFESDKKPVIIEFELHKIKNTDVPGYAELKDAMLKCARFWRKQNNIKTANFFDKAVEIMNKNYIRVLRVSDYNTKGLTGSDKLYNTPWQNLVKSNGVSDKGSSAGGSFGIGKSAPFACSDLRTVFYRTLDENGLRASQGVSKLVSFLDDKDDITAGIGYYGEVDKNTSVKYIQELENINVRNEKGTDIFIIGFLNEESWKKNLIVELLESFLLAILDGNLEVIIEGEVINKDTIESFIKKYENDLKYAGSYFKVIKSKDTEIITTNFENMGTVELKVLIQDKLPRNVLISRSNGMKLFDKNGISSTIQFAAILEMHGQKINSFFREMESPQHNAWEEDRCENSKKARDTQRKLFKWVKDSILEKGKYGTGDEIDAEGVGDFIPDFIDMGLNTSKKETISDTTKSLEIKVVEKPISTSGMGSYLDINGDEDGKGALDEDGPYDSIDVPSGPPNNSDGGTGSPHNAKNGEGDRPIKVGKQIKKCSMKLFVSDQSKGEYTLIFNTNQNIKKGYLSIKISGEQNNSDAIVDSAVNKTLNQKVLCDREKIIIKDIKNNCKNKVVFTLKEDELYPLEVAVYEN